MRFTQARNLVKCAIRTNQLGFMTLYRYELNMVCTQHYEMPCYCTDRYTALTIVYRDKCSLTEHGLGRSVGSSLDPIRTLDALKSKGYYFTFESVMRGLLKSDNVDALEEILLHHTFNDSGYNVHGLVIYMWDKCAVRCLRFFCTRGRTFDIWKKMELYLASSWPACYSTTSIEFLECLFEHYRAFFTSDVIQHLIDFNMHNLPLMEWIIKHLGIERYIVGDGDHSHFAVGLKYDQYMAWTLLVSPHIADQKTLWKNMAHFISASITIEEYTDYLNTLPTNDKELKRYCIMCHYCDELAFPVNYYEPILDAKKYLIHTENYKHFSFAKLRHIMSYWFAPQELITPEFAPCEENRDAYVIYWRTLES